MNVRLSVLIGLFCAVAGRAWGENRYYVDESPLPAGSSDQEIALLADTDQALLGYSFGIRVEPAKLAILDITSTGSVAENADFFVGAFDGAAGVANYGAVFFLDKEDYPAEGLEPGTGHIIATLHVDVLATAETTTTIRYEAVSVPSASAEPAKNVMTDTGANSIFPALVAGTIPIEAEGGETTFVRGDPDSDGQIIITDGIVTLSYLFLPGGVEPKCLDAADADDNGNLEVTDAVLIFTWLFVDSTRPPRPPSPTTGNYGVEDCGVDPTAEDPPLGCEAPAATCE